MHAAQPVDSPALPVDFCRVDLVCRVVTWGNLIQALATGRPTSRVERLIDVPENVFDVFQTNGETHEIGADAG